MTSGALTDPRVRVGRTHARSPEGILGRADDMIVFMGVNFYPMQVEQVVRSFEELSPEYRIRLTHDSSTHRDICTISVELEQKGMPPEQVSALQAKAANALREGLGFPTGGRILLVKEL